MEDLKAMKNTIDLLMEQIEFKDKALSNYDLSLNELENKFDKLKDKYETIDMDYDDLQEEYNDINDYTDNLYDLRIQYDQWKNYKQPNDERDFFEDLEELFKLIY